MRKTSTLLQLFVILTTMQAFGGTRPGKMAVPIPEKTSNIQMLSTFLITAAGNMADGNRVVFDNQYSNTVDGNDAVKITNPGENFAVMRDNQILAVEARQNIASGDTIFYVMSRLVPQVYQLQIQPEYLAVENIKCELVDKFMRTRTLINLNENNNLTLTVTSDVASRASDRLFIVFSSTQAPVPAAAFEFADISATSNAGKTVTVNFGVAHEVNVASYTIERSADNIHFEDLGILLPVANSNNATTYSYNDLSALAGESFYRINSLSRNGNSVYSEKVKIVVPVSTEMMSIFPNPAVNNNFQLRLNHLAAGKYLVKISNNSGQPVYSTFFTVNSSIFMQTITLNAGISKGNYNVSIFSADKVVSTERLILQ